MFTVTIYFLESGFVFLIQFPIFFWASLDDCSMLFADEIVIAQSSGNNTNISQFLCAQEFNLWDCILW